MICLFVIVVVVVVVVVVVSVCVLLLLSFSSYCYPSFFYEFLCVFLNLLIYLFS